MCDVLAVGMFEYACPCEIVELINLIRYEYVLMCMHV
jgi:hypothetical protein